MEPGNALQVDIVGDFPAAYIRHFDLASGFYTDFRNHIRIPIAPFCGTKDFAQVTTASRSIGKCALLHLGTPAKGSAIQGIIG